VANEEQARAWNGDEGDRWTDHEERYNAAVRRHTRRLLDAAGISPADHVLDIGCGCGESTRDAARAAGSGRALGVDLSARMIERARERTRLEGLTNAAFEQADAQVHAFEAEAYDLAISRFGVMFFDDPVAAFTNIGRALRRSGRLVLLAWQGLKENDWASAFRDALAAGRALPEPPAGAPGAFGLADPERIRRILAEGGFADVGLKEMSEPMFLGADPADAFTFVRNLGITHGMLESLDETSRARALEEMRATLSAHDTGEGVLFGSRAWLITAKRV
jgi:SAM-dependent methyltransferase